ncbi:MAG: hypothetical protein ACE5LU_09290 [Anaerolineae bacterium]
MTDPEVALLLSGAAIALASSLITAWLQHHLSLRAEETRMELQREKEEAEERRRNLLEGVQIRSLREALTKQQDALRGLLFDTRKRFGQLYDKEYHTDARWLREQDKVVHLQRWQLSELRGDHNRTIELIERTDHELRELQEAIGKEVDRMKKLKTEEGPDTQAEGQQKSA